MTIAELTKAMIDDSAGNLHDIHHFLKVYAYAKTIGECEQLAPETQMMLEAAALLHDIACPLCREKYGNTNGSYQEAEGQILAADFLKGRGFSQDFIDRVAYLVGHHHTLTDVDGLDYQILLEADYLVNAAESQYPPENIRHALNILFKTPTGCALLKSIYGVC